MIIIAERAFKISDSGPELKFLKIWGMSQNWAIKRLPYYNGWYEKDVRPLFFK